MKTHKILNKDSVENRKFGQKKIFFFLNIVCIINTLHAIFHKKKFN